MQSIYILINIRSKFPSSFILLIIDRGVPIRDLRLRVESVTVREKSERRRRERVEKGRRGKTGGRIHYFKNSSSSLIVLMETKTMVLILL